jgi:hypothetical protein
MYFVVSFLMGDLIRKEQVDFLALFILGTRGIDECIVPHNDL